MHRPAHAPAPVAGRVGAAIVREVPMPAVTLTTPRLQLRPMQATDVDALLHVFGDPRVMAAFDEPPFDRAQMERWVQRNLAHQAEHGFGLFTVVLAATDLVIGDCGLEVMAVDGAPAAELGYDVRSDHWHQGYATEAATAVRDYAFQALGLPRLVSLIRHGNEPSRRVAERIGMRQVRDITHHGRRYWHYEIVAAATETERPATT
jgi:RimJ/RimL family protein N-acetyltransferase